METLIALLILSAGAGFQIPLPLTEITTTADAIVVGTIAEVSKTTFTLRIDEVLAGEIEGRQIEVEKFPTSAESPRWAPYCRGQSVALFLSKTSSGRFRILGRLGEGEIPLDERYAYFHGRYIDVLRPDYHDVHGRRVYIQRFDRKATLDAIRAYRRCFRPEGSCTEKELDALRSRSEFHRYLLGR